MNQLCDLFPGRLAVLAFPCNQFGQQENCEGGEILRSLQYVRPGGGFTPKAVVFDKVDVNGEAEHPVFTFLKQSLPRPADKQAGSLGNPKLIVWSPVLRSDISWNFEKFLISPAGTPVKRFSRHFPMRDIESDIRQLL